MYCSIQGLFEMHDIGIQLYLIKSVRLSNPTDTTRIIEDRVMFVKYHSLLRNTMTIFYLIITGRRMHRTKGIALYYVCGGYSISDILNKIHFPSIQVVFKYIISQHRAVLIRGRLLILKIPGDVLS